MTVSIDHNSQVAVGDLNSDAKGSGARKNAGKPQLDLVPVSIWYDRWNHSEAFTPKFTALFVALMRWQKGHEESLKHWLSSTCESQDLESAIRVLEFGIKKYKAWNWAKGMPWSVCLGCILRHCARIINNHEELDADSGESHWGHIVANVIFLVHYIDHYPEGDDRPPYFNAA